MNETDVGVPVDCNIRNSDVNWDTFDSAAYFVHNYGDLRPDDTQIIRIVADHFAESLPGRPPGRAIDVGTGANLYPAMIMMPYATELTLLEQASSNREWLRAELEDPHPSWSSFWNEVAEGRPAYRRIEQASGGKTSRALRAVSRVQAGSVFDLQPDQYDLGTMFFVAESITTQIDEFERAAGQFIDSLKPTAPFAAAFMCDSSGYLVGDRHFPACSVNEKDVDRALARAATDVKIVYVESKDLREGYGGMIVATGRRM